MIPFTCAIQTGSSANEETEKSASSYPLSTCIVSGEKLGAMGPPYIMKYHGTEVRFCCEGCVKDFNQDPEKYLKLLHVDSH